MADVGSELADARARRGLSVGELARRTRITEKTLEAIERNDASVLPRGIHTRGFLRAYAREVGCDPEDIVTRYLEQVDLREPASQEQLESIKACLDTEQVRVHSADIDALDRRRGRRRIAMMVMLLAGVAFYLVASHRPPVHVEASVPKTPFVSGLGDTPPPGTVQPDANQAASTVGTSGSPEATPTGQPPAVDPKATAVTEPPTAAESGASPAATPSAPSPPVDANGQPPVASPPGVDASATPAAPPTALPSSDQMRIEIVTRGLCWLSASADGRQVSYRMLDAGEHISMEGHEGFVLRVGDAANVQLMINGVPARQLGPPGQPVTVHLTPQNYREYLNP